MVLAEAIKNLLDEEVNVTILLLIGMHGSSISFREIWIKYLWQQNICQMYSEFFLIFLREGEGPGQLRSIRASEMMDSENIGKGYYDVQKNMSLSRVRRTFSIMGRDEDSSDHDLSAFFYPALQAADIFELEIDIALGGMDQRKSHMYTRK